MNNEQEIKQLEEKLELLKNQRVHVWKLYVKLDPNDSSNEHYIFGLNNPADDIYNKTYDLPEGFLGRGAFSKKDVKEIAHGLLKMIGED